MHSVAAGLLGGDPGKHSREHISWHGPGNMESWAIESTEQELSRRKGPTRNHDPTEFSEAFSCP